MPNIMNCLTEKFVIKIKNEIPNAQKNVVNEAILQILNPVFETFNIL